MPGCAVQSKSITFRIIPESWNSIDSKRASFHPTPNRVSVEPSMRSLSYRISINVNMLQCRTITTRIPPDTDDLISNVVIGYVNTAHLNRLNVIVHAANYTVSSSALYHKGFVGAQIPVLRIIKCHSIAFDSLDGAGS